MTRGKIVAIWSTSAGALGAHTSDHDRCEERRAGGDIVARIDLSRRRCRRRWRKCRGSASGYAARDGVGAAPPYSHWSGGGAHVYAECASIWNPIHSERRIAIEQGLPDIILHGTATWATAGREIVAFHADGDPARLKRLRATFRAPVVPGHEITLLHGSCQEAAVAYRVINHRGEVAIADGYAEIERTRQPAPTSLPIPRFIRSLGSMSHGCCGNARAPAAIGPT